MTPSSFRFRLEPVLVLRERAEDAAKEHLAEGLVLRDRGERELREALARLDAARVERRQAGVLAPISADQLRDAQAYLERVERARRAASADLRRCDAELAARREALTVAARERQVLERLRERDLERFRREAARREGALLDELGLAAHRRRSSEAAHTEVQR